MTINLFKNKSLQLIMLFCTLIAVSGCTSAQNSPDLQKMVEDGAYMVDVRTPQEFAEGHVRESVNIPVDEVAANIDKFKSKKNIIVFCRSGARAEKAKKVLEANGIKNVSNGGSWEDINKFKPSK